MEVYEKSMKVMSELFARDYQFALATTNQAEEFPFEFDIIPVN